MIKTNALQDSLQRFIFDKAPVRGEYIRLTNSFQTIVKQHAYPESIQKLVGEALCAAGLLRATLKFDGRLTVQFRGKGNLKLLLAQCDSQFHIRGLAKWEGELSYADLMDAFNQGVLVIMLETAQGKQYQGIVSWQGNSLAESIEGYFKDSEQLMTRIWLAVDEESAVGYLLQVIPDKTDETKEMVNAVITPHWERITRQSENLTPEEILAGDYQNLLDTRYTEDEIRIFPPTDITFKCTCSKKRSQDAVLMLGQKEAEAELKDKQVLVVTCDFCNQEYVFNQDDVSYIFNHNGQPPSQTQH